MPTTKHFRFKPVVVDWCGLKCMGWPFSRTETDRGEEEGRYPKSYKLGRHPNSRRVWRVKDVLEYFEAHGLRVTEDWLAPDEGVKFCTPEQEVHPVVAVRR
jgi:hypothetical protein